VIFGRDAGLSVYDVADCSVDVCRGTRCLNGGSCVAKDADVAMCLCPFGTHGSHCQHRTSSSHMSIVIL